jgi:hypothetical protein
MLWAGRLIAGPSSITGADRHRRFEEAEGRE